MDNSINVDKAAHRVCEFHRNSILCSGTVIDGDWRAFYHESRLYSVYNSRYYFTVLIYANNPYDAIRRIKEAFKEREENETDN